MNDITIFHSKEFGDMHTIAQNGQPWFIGKEVASILGTPIPGKLLMTTWMQKIRG